MNDHLGAAEEYYGKQGRRERTYSMVGPNTLAHDHSAARHNRRVSIDGTSSNPRQFYIRNIDQTLERLLQNEDTDGDYQITIEDTGPKILKLGTANSDGYTKRPIRGTYMLSNLLQELTIAKGLGKKEVVLDERRLSENPVLRLRRLISTQFWSALTREVSPDNLMEMAKDTKFPQEYVDKDGKVQYKDATYRIYVPHNRQDQYKYLSQIRDDKKLDLSIEYLPETFDAHYIKSINSKPGLLALAAHANPSGSGMFNEPYVVPGGRFNELYGWDSYMVTVGLLVDAQTRPEHIRLARGMTENFLYEIEHYGKILNANRSYYLGRSQPPFLTDMAIRVYQATKQAYPDRTDTENFLQRAMVAAIKEYETIWCEAPRLDPASGLSCYHPDGKGVPPETEASHFNTILEPYAQKHAISKEEFIRKFNDGEIDEPDLDEYFLHDRAVRESGHDTSYRLEGKAAHLATVDLNSLLYKYETDLAEIIGEHFGSLEWNGKTYTAETWAQRAQLRKERIDKYLWNEEDGIYYDYNIKTHEQHKYVSATAFWPLYACVASKEQAQKLVAKTLPQLEEYGGLVAGTLESRGKIGLHRPSRQWDYPFGWAPHQILLWIGLDNYGFVEDNRRMAYRWLYMMTKTFQDYNGVVVEKYKVTKGPAPHKVDAEYGNQGLGFKGVAREGFGWVNASYVFGLTFLDDASMRELEMMRPPAEVSGSNQVS